MVHTRKKAFIRRSDCLHDNDRMTRHLPSCSSRKTPPAAVKLAAALAFLFCGLGVQTASAGGKDDHERARQALQAGQVLPLRSVLQRLEREQPGQVLEVELEQEGGRWIYEVKLLQADGRLLKLKLDARTAVLLQRKSRDGSDHGKPDEKR